MQSAAHSSDLPGLSCNLPALLQSLRPAHEPGEHGRGDDDHFSRVGRGGGVGGHGGQDGGEAGGEEEQEQECQNPRISHLTSFDILK